MKISSITKALAAVSVSLVSATASNQPASNNEVTLYMEGTHVMPSAMLAQARQTVNRIFAGAGVQVQWKLGEKQKPKTRGAEPAQCAIEIRVQFLSRAPEDVSPGAFARTFPLQTKELRIDVLAERFESTLRRQTLLLAGLLLGHVLAHEIAHVLQGVGRHSEAGILRAHWSEGDYRQMQRGLMEFDREEVKLIHLGIESRLRRCSTEFATAR